MTTSSLPGYSPQQADVLLDFCRRLVRIPSLSGAEGQVAQVVAAQMQALGFDSIEGDDLGNVIGIVNGDLPGPTRLLDAHMDVVPVTSPAEWRHDPYGAEIEGGRLWGRGAADTKGSLAGIVCAAGFIPRSELRGRAVVVASVCEENMTGAALQQVLRRYPADMFVTGEPTGLHLGVAQKGRATLSFAAAGRSAHTSRPELGENAAYKMIEVVQRIRQMPTESDPQLGPEIFELSELVSEPLPGTAFVPHGCRARFIGRLMPGENAAHLLERLRRAVQDIPGVTIELSELRQTCYTGRELVAADFIPGWRNPADDAWQNGLLAQLAAAGLPDELFYAPCGTNASTGAGLFGLPSFILGPGTLAEAHIVDEWLALDDLFAGLQAFGCVLRTCPEG